MVSVVCVYICACGVHACVFPHTLSHIHLPLHSSPPSVSPVSVVLCAPTRGFCHQLEQQLTHTLQVMLALCQDDSDGPATAVAGGGAWEMAMIRQLEACILEQKITK